MGPTVLQFLKVDPLFLGEHLIGTPLRDLLSNIALGFGILVLMG